MNRVRVSKRRWVFLPVETKARELLGNTLLACIAAEKGWGAIIGKKVTVRNKQTYMPRGTFIEKNLAPKRVSFIDEAKARGNLVSAWGEEGLLYINRNFYYESKLEPRYFDPLDYYFAWGENEAEDISQALNYRGNKVIISGNPRFDLLRPELRGLYARSSDELKAQYGDIVLINTNFSPINRNLKGYDHLKVHRATGKIKTPEQEALMLRYLYFKKQIFEHFMNMLPVLSEKFNSHTIVVRPHPSENHTPWLEKTAGLPNVKIIFEKSAAEWIQACDVLIHNNCTTGVESFLMEKPTISYRPYVDETVEHPLTNQTSFQANDLGELVNFVQRFTNNKIEISPQEREEQLSFARRYIANLDGEFACETIMDTLDNLDLPEMEGFFPLPGTLKEKAGKIKRRINPLKYKDNYTKQKFPGITLKEIENIITELKKVSERFRHISVLQIDVDVFCFYNQ